MRRDRISPPGRPESFFSCRRNRAIENAEFLRHGEQRSGCRDNGYSSKQVRSSPDNARADFDRETPQDIVGQRGERGARPDGSPNGPGGGERRKEHKKKRGKVSFER